MVLTKENCSICFNYWTSHGRYRAGYNYLICDQHIPEAHANHGRHTSSGPSVADLRGQLNNANSRANGLQSQLDAANSRNNTLQKQVNDANTQIGGLRTQLGAANSRANDLQRQLDECRREKRALEGQISQLKIDKVNLETMNKTLQDQMKKKDNETVKFQAAAMDAQNKIQTQLEPYIQVLQLLLRNNGIPYPPGP